MALSTCTLTATVLLDSDPVSGTYTATPTLPGSPPGSELTPQSKSGSFTAGALSIALDRAKESDTWPRYGHKYTVVVTVLGQTQTFEVWVDSWDAAIDLGPINFVRPAADVDRSNDIAVGESTISRLGLETTAQSTSGVLYLQYFTASKTEVINQLKIWTSTTAAAATPTIIRMGVWAENPDGSLTRVGVTANDTTLLSGGNTAYPKALAAPFTKYKNQRYAFGILVVSAAAMPTYRGFRVIASANYGAVLGQAPRVSAQVTGQADIPDTIAVGSLSYGAPIPIYAELLP